MKRKLLFVVISAVVSVLSAGTVYTPYTNSTTIKPGEWNSNFALALEYAESRHIPIVMFNASQACTYSGIMDKALATEEAQEWIATHKPVASFVYPAAAEVTDVARSARIGDTKYPDTWKAVNWFRQNGGVMALPMMAIYWPKADGTKVLKTFIGRNGKIPNSVTKGSSVAAISAQVIEAWQSLLGDYVPGDEEPEASAYLGGTFTVEGSVYAAVDTTTSVMVDVSRCGVEAANEQMTVKYPSGHVAEVKVSWAKSVTNQLVAVSLDSKEYHLGKSVELSFADGDGVKQSAASILYMAEPPNSTQNPDWIGAAESENDVTVITNPNAAYNFATTQEVAVVNATDIDPENKDAWIATMMAKAVGVLPEERMAFGRGLTNLVAQMVFGETITQRLSSCEMPLLLETVQTTEIQSWTNTAEAISETVTNRLEWTCDADDAVLSGPVLVDFSASADGHDPKEYETRYEVATNDLSRIYKTNGWTRVITEKWNADRTKMESAETNWIVSVNEIVTRELKAKTWFSKNIWNASLRVSRVKRYWIDDSKMLKCGEWTMDLETATNHVAWLNGASEIGKPEVGDDKAVTFVYFSGVLWNVDSQALSDNLLDLGEFTGWAEANNVALVQMDLPPEGAEGPSLVSTSIGDGGLASLIKGLAYLSRKGGYTDAGVIFDRNAAYAEKWAAEGDARIAVPTLLALNAKGEVAARMTFEGVAPTAYGRNYLKRCDEMLAAARAGKNEANAYLATSKLKVGAHDSVDGELSAVSPVRLFRLKSPVTETQQLVAVTGVSERQAKVRVSLSLESGVGPNAYLEPIAVATGTLGLGRGVTLAAEISNAKLCYWVSVEVAEYAGAFALDGADESTEVQFALATGEVLQPELAANAKKITDGIANLSLEKDQHYRLEGLDTESDAFKAAFDHVDGLIYTARNTGPVRLPATNETATVTYRLWDAGTVAFALPEVMAFAVAESGKVEVCRSGCTGKAAVTVSLEAPAETGSHYVYETQRLTWDDMESGSKYVTFGMKNLPAFTGKESFMLVLRADDASDIPVDEAARACDVTVYPEDKPVFKLATEDICLYQNLQGQTTVDVLNVQGTVTVKASGLPSGVKVSYAGGKLVITGKPTSLTKVPKVAAVTVSDKRSDGSVRQNTVTLNFSVVTGQDLNPYAAKAVKGRIDFYERQGDRDVLVGTIASFATTAKNGVSAKYQAVESSSAVAFSGNWQTIDADGNLVAKLVKSGHALSLVLSKDGALSATLDGRTGAGCLQDKGLDYSAFAGTANVPLEVVSVSGSSSATNTVTIALTVKKDGTVTYKGTYPDKKTFTGGSTALYATAEPGVMVMTLFRFASSYQIAGWLTIDAEKRVAVAGETSFVISYRPKTGASWSALMDVKR